VAVLRRQSHSLQARLEQCEQTIQALQQYIGLLLKLGNFRPPTKE
jgi:hypothetical protein